MCIPLLRTKEENTQINYESLRQQQKKGKKN